MLTIVFYATDGAAAKLRTREIAATKNYARCYDVAMWDGTEDRCDNVEIMPDVPPWQRERIMKVYGEPVEQEEIQEPGQSPEADLPPEGSSDPEPVVEKKAVHRGGGRWFVMAGDDIVSGPHDKAEAAKLAENT